MKSNRSENHKLYLDNITLEGLCANDDKRYIRDCGIASYAYGHHKVRDIVNENIFRSLYICN